MPASRIMIAVSSPWASEKLVRPIADLCARLQAEALVAHVATVQDEDDEESEAAERGEATLKALVGGLEAVGVRAEGVMLFSDDTPKAILKTARSKQCTTIVLGLTGKGVLKRLIAGDVPSNLIRQTDLPVLLLPANWDGSI